MQKLTSFNNYTSKNNLALHICKIPKFKTNLFQFYIIQPLKKETATRTALIPYLLYRGSRNYPTSRDFILRLDELYGANLNISVVKRGENQVIRFTLEIINENFIPEKEKLQVEGLRLLKDLIFNPLLKKGIFRDNYVEQEKTFLKDEIESLVNNKYNYAMERCYQVMCSREPFGIYKLGSVSDLKELNSENLYEHYQKLIKENYMGIFIIGDVDEKKVYDQVSQIFDPEHNQPEVINKTLIRNDVKEVREVVERMNIRQGKLTLGFRTGITRESELYYALMVYNGILGGFPHSKLFQNVREKASLAYYASSNIESTKGLLLINSGIEFSHYEKAKEIILKQIMLMKKGEIEPKEFEWTKKGLINQLKSAADNNNHLAGHYLLGLINDKSESVETMIEMIKRVEVSDVVEAAEQIKLDTIYFLNKGE